MPELLCSCEPFSLGVGGENVGKFISLFPTLEIMQKMFQKYNLIDGIQKSMGILFVAMIFSVL
jgi:hypothetical protein